MAGGSPCCSLVWVILRMPVLPLPHNAFPLSHTHTPSHSHPRRTHARCADYVTRADFERQEVEVQGLREQLVAVMEELASRERELAEIQDVHHRYLSKMQTYADQVG
jgi:hypothetical protein